MKQNQFNQDMIRLQLPADRAPQVSVAGFSVDADEQHCVTVPKGPIADELMCHGLTPAAAVDAGAKKK